MRIQEIRIENIKGIEALTLKPGAVTVISGSNGQGKTSVLDALRAVFDGGHDPAIIRQGAKKGEVVLTMDDGTVIEVGITPKTRTAKIVNGQGLIVPKPQTFIERLASGLALDPVSLITAKPKDRAAFLLKTIDFTVAPGELAEIGIKSGPVNLEGLNALRKQVYDTRRETNVRGDEHSAQVAALRKALPADSDTDWAAESARLEEEYIAATNSLSAIEAEYNRQWTSYKADTDARFQAKIDALREEWKETLRASQIEFEQDKAEATLDALETVRELTGKRAAAKAKAEEQSRASAIREQIEAAQAKAQEFAAKSIAFDRQLAAIDELKAKKLAEQSLDGVEVVDGEIVVGGIPFDKLNTARQYEIAFALCSRGAGESPLMICDRAESLDDAKWSEFVEAGKGSGFQVLAARVENGPLKVEVVA